MGASLRSWWQKIKQHPMRTVSVTLLAVVIVLIILSILGYIFNWGWTGLGTYISPPYPKDSDFQRGKTLWDWLQLLIIPAVLAVAGYVINLTISRGEQDATERRARSEREAAEKRAETEREIALDDQKETSWKEYIDKMSELILHEDLLGPDSKKEVQEIARLRTLTVLNRLDGKRKGSVLQFLKDSELICEGVPIIALFKANLRGAYLREAFLSGTHLYHVDLSGADLRQAQLGHIPPSGDEDYIQGANLSRANLSEADLSKADLEEVNLRSASLTKSNLNGAYLEGADLSHASLIDANLSNTQLTKAIFYRADLTRANLTNAQLNLEIKWGERDQFGADLRQANLKDVIGITDEELERTAKSLEGAIMPSGKRHP